MLSLNSTMYLRRPKWFHLSVRLAASEWMGIRWGQLILWVWAHCYTSFAMKRFLPSEVMECTEWNNGEEGMPWDSWGRFCQKHSRYYCCSALMRGSPCSWAHTWVPPSSSWPLEPALWWLGKSLNDTYGRERILFMWLLSTSSAVDAHWWAFIWDSLCPIWEVQPHISSPKFFVISLLVLLLSSPWSSSQTVHSHPWISVNPHFWPALIPDRVGH